MNYIKIMFKSFIYMLGSVIFLTFLVSLLSYFDILNNKIFNVISFIIPLFSFALGGFVVGKNSKKNGWLEGLKLGIIGVFIVLIFNLVFVHTVGIKDWIFYILLIVSSITGSMLGINKK